MRDFCEPDSVISQDEQTGLSLAKQSKSEEEAMKIHIPIGSEMGQMPSEDLKNQEDDDIKTVSDE